jgi:hypothetical protein
MVVVRFENGADALLFGLAVQKRTVCGQMPSLNAF